MASQILAPAAVLILWSLVMLIWMSAVRLPELAKLKKNGGSGKTMRGGRGQDLEGRIPDHVNWKAHNYAHLMEQPTLFYAVVAILAILGPTQDTVIAAWFYTILRIVHSFWQSLVNTIPWRIGLFTLGSLALLYLAIRALMVTL
ncbi:MAPEG family protein [Aurantiacibacter marinus]|uniref:Membrane protein n=1 Tax=Aurantiacibacter marinus TaxID=874156 RepID=A0A0H0XM36_9SPHN|nr:MAPEG family protein [Aurantiacibacter marinus]KLI63086.1 membrane protein [Aurantiacibacter marinus]